jgi:sugar phosphate isomerase/epimerase
MYSALSPGCISVRTDSLAQRIAAAKKYGFGGVEIDVFEIADMIDASDAEAVKSQFIDADIIAAGWGLPTDFRGSEENWQRDLKVLGRLAKAAAAVDSFRTFTWISPASNDRDLESNTKFHIERLTPVAEILGEHGVRFGMEFIGPKTIRASHKFEFVSTMAGMLELARKIGPNVGLLVDCWHLYTSHGAMSDIEKLDEADVVYVHVNDAPAGIPIDEQIDNRRDLPGATGVIDIAGFLGALKKIGYSGPVVAEPFKDELKSLADDEARLDVVAKSMHKVFSAG